MPQTQNSQENGNQNLGGGQNTQKLPMRDNLHFAADNLSNAMSSLVRELNTGHLMSSVRDCHRLEGWGNGGKWGMMLVVQGHNLFYFLHAFFYCQHFSKSSERGGKVNEREMTDCWSLDLSFAFLGSNLMWKSELTFQS